MRWVGQSAPISADKIRIQIASKCAVLALLAATAPSLGDLGIVGEPFRLVSEDPDLASPDAFSASVATGSVFVVFSTADFRKRLWLIEGGRDSIGASNIGEQQSHHGQGDHLAIFVYR